MNQKEIDRLWSLWWEWAKQEAKLRDEYPNYHKFPRISDPAMMELPNLLLELDGDHCLDEIRGITRTKSKCGGWQKTEVDGVTGHRMQMFKLEVE